MKSRAQTIADLQAAIDAYTGDTGPGYWYVEPEFNSGSGVPAVGLIFECPQRKLVGEGGELEYPDCLHVKSGDEPWKHWGGTAILTTAGVNNFDGMADSYADERGERYIEAAIIAVEQEAAAE